jgi:choice-of-anchor B domain-containing protein
MKFVFTFLLLTFFLQTYAQVNNNIELVSHIILDENANDIWGYVDNEGIEYAIIGTRRDTKIFSLENPTEPILRAEIAGTFSTWRDIKSYETNLYVIADRGTDGLLIIDMSEAPTKITSKKLNIGFSDGVINRCHNLYIDTTEAVLFLAGCNTSGGILAYDLNNNPGDPQFISKVSTNYSHDVFAQNGYVYSSEINNGQLGIYDIKNIEQPGFLGSVKTTNQFTHNAWANEDDSVVFTTDEVSNGTLDAYDISDKSNPILIDVFVPPSIKDKGTTPHNTHFIDNYLVSSWYTYGVVITDVSNANKIVETGNFDTQMGSGSGCWGTYPYLPSGLILASDIGNGLFILNPTYERAAYLKGLITDEENGLPIINATVKIVSSSPNNENSNSKGEYIIGQIEEGNFDVVFDHPDYDAKTINIDLTKNEQIVLNVELKKTPIYNLDFKVISNSQEEIESANILISNHEWEYELLTDKNGKADSIIVSGTYDIIVGKWGYKYSILRNVKLQNKKQFVFQLRVGYEDNFVFDFGWSTETPNVRSEWVRVEPILTSYEGQISNPGEDVENDFGNKCYVTGNGKGGAGQYDVDDGDSKLISPTIDLSDYQNAKLKFTPWFFNDGGSSTLPDDTFKIYITNGIDTNLIAQFPESTGGWGPEVSVNLSEFITLNDSIQIIYSAADVGDSHLVEAGLDGFEIILDPLTNAMEHQDTFENWTVLSNPTSKNIYLKCLKSTLKTQLILYNVEGKLISKIDTADFIEGETIEIQRPKFSGLYILNVLSDNNSLESFKIIIHN